VVEVFDAIGAADTSLVSHLVFLMGPVLPILLKLPTGENRLFRKLRLTMSAIADELLDRTRKEKTGGITPGEKVEEKSIVGLLSGCIISPSTRVRLIDWQSRPRPQIRNCRCHKRR